MPGKIKVENTVLALKIAVYHPTVIMTSETNLTPPSTQTEIKVICTHQAVVLTLSIQM
jgi:hypothetical protein